MKNAKNFRSMQNSDIYILHLVLYILCRLKTIEIKVPLLTFFSQLYFFLLLYTYTHSFSHFFLSNEQYLLVIWQCLFKYRLEHLSFQNFKYNFPLNIWNWSTVNQEGPWLNQMLSLKMVSPFDEMDFIYLKYLSKLIVVAISILNCLRKNKVIQVFLYE